MNPDELQIHMGHASLSLGVELTRNDASVSRGTEGGRWGEMMWGCLCAAVPEHFNRAALLYSEFRLQLCMAVPAATDTAVPQEYLCWAVSESVSWLAFSPPI